MQTDASDYLASISYDDIDTNYYTIGYASYDGNCSVNHFFSARCLNETYMQQCAPTSINAIYSNVTMRLRIRPMATNQLNAGNVTVVYGNRTIFDNNRLCNYSLDYICDETVAISSSSTMMMSSITMSTPDIY